MDLLCELYAFYNEGFAVARETVRSHLFNNLLGGDSLLRLAVAHGDSGQVFGLAAFSLTYSLVEPAPKHCRHCQLKELYVRSSNRNVGVGKAIMSWVAQYALDQGCSRIDWPVKATNAKGIAFYKGLGAEHVTERLSFRLSEPSLSQVARMGIGANDG